MNGDAPLERHGIDWAEHRVALERVLVAVGWCYRGAVQVVEMNGVAADLVRPDMRNLSCAVVVSVVQLVVGRTAEPRELGIANIDVRLVSKERVSANPSGVLG